MRLPADRSWPDDHLGFNSERASCRMRIPQNFSLDGDTLAAEGIEIAWNPGKHPPRSCRDCDEIVLRLCVQAVHRQSRCSDQWLLRLRNGS